VTGPRFDERLEHVMTVFVTYQDGATEPLRFEGPTDWDVKDGHLVAWNETGNVVAERDNVDTAIYHRTLAE
jgi:hypothetical protein